MWWLATNSLIINAEYSTSSWNTILCFCYFKTTWYNFYKHLNTSLQTLSCVYNDITCLLIQTVTLHCVTDSDCTLCYHHICCSIHLNFSSFKHLSLCYFVTHGMGILQLVIHLFFNYDSAHCSEPSKRNLQ